MEKKKKIFRHNRGIFFLLVVICCILVGTVLKIASGVILPFTIAFLLAFVMFPIVSWLDKRGIPRIVSILLVVVIILAGLYLFAFIIYTSGTNIMSVYWDYESRFREIYSYAAQMFDLPNDESLSFFDNLWGQLGIRNVVTGFAISFSNILFRFLSDTVLVILFVVFILLEAKYFKEKLEAAFRKRSEQFDKMGRDLITQVTRYLTTKFFLSLATGVIITLGLWLVGLEFAILWGVLAFVLNFIPNLGSIAAGAITSLFALIQFWPNPLPVIFVVALFLAVNMVIGNFLDTKIIGDNVGLSPLVVLISLGLWGYIWGFMGMILSVPMTVIIKIICENIPIMEPVSILLGTRKSVKSKKEKKFFIKKINENIDNIDENRENTVS